MRARFPHLVAVARVGEDLTPVMEHRAFRGDAYGFSIATDSAGP